MTAVNERTADFESEMYLSEIWVDHALNFEAMKPCRGNLSLSYDVLDKIWKPNTGILKTIKTVKNTEFSVYQFKDGSHTPISVSQHFCANLFKWNCVGQRTDSSERPLQYGVFFLSNGHSTLSFNSRILQLQ